MPGFQEPLVGGCFRGCFLTAEAGFRCGTQSTPRTRRATVTRPSAVVSLSGQIIMGGWPLPASTYQKAPQWLAAGRTPVTRMDCSQRQFTTLRKSLSAFGTCSISRSLRDDGHPSPPEEQAEPESPPSIGTIHAANDDVRQGYHKPSILRLFDLHLTYFHLAHPFFPFRFRPRTGCVVISWHHSLETEATARELAQVHRVYWPVPTNGLLPRSNLPYRAFVASQLATLPRIFLEVVARVIPP